MAGFKFEPYVYTGSGANDQKCYVCGSEGNVHIRALTASDESAREIQEMYRTLGLYATVVPHDAISPDVQIGACPDHTPNLKKLDEAHRRTKRITLKSIVDSFK